MAGDNLSDNRLNRQGVDCAAETATPGRPSESVSSRLFEACYASTTNTLTIPALEPNVPATKQWSDSVQGNSAEANVYMRARDGIVNIEMLNARNQHTAQASGFFVTQDGYIATDNHAVVKGQKYVVTTSDGQKYWAGVAGVDQANDLALLKITPYYQNQKFQALPLGSSSLKQGDAAMVLGHPDADPRIFASPGAFQGWLPFTSVYGGKPEDIPPGMNTSRYLMISQMHGAPGDSGGPMVNLRGQVVGVLDLSDGAKRADATPVEPLIELLRRVRFG